MSIIAVMIVNYVLYTLLFLEYKDPCDMRMMLS